MRRSTFYARIYKREKTNTAKDIGRSRQTAYVKIHVERVTGLLRKYE